MVPLTKLLGNFLLPVYEAEEEVCDEVQVLHAPGGEGVLRHIGVVDGCPGVGDPRHQILRT